jgi:hypothetical protein
MEDLLLRPSHLPFQRTDRPLRHWILSPRRRARIKAWWGFAGMRGVVMYWEVGSRARQSDEMPPIRA